MFLFSPTLPTTPSQMNAFVCTSAHGSCSDKAKIECVCEICRLLWRGQPTHTHTHTHIMKAIERNQERTDTAQHTQTRQQDSLHASPKSHPKVLHKSKLTPGAASARACVRRQDCVSRMPELKKSARAHTRTHARRHCYHTFVLHKTTTDETGQTQTGAEAHLNI